MVSGRRAMVARVARGAAYFLQRYGKETRTTAETPEKMTASERCFNCYGQGDGGSDVGIICKKGMKKLGVGIGRSRHLS